MSFKARNLAYEKPSEPAFLSRMRAQVSGQADADRSQQAVPRRKGIAPRNEALSDDSPTIVDEQGNALSEQDIEALNHGEEGVVAAGMGNTSATSPSEENNDAPRNANMGRKDAQEVAEAGKGAPRNRKRKAGKVIGLDAHEDEDDEHSGKAEADRATKTHGPQAAKSSDAREPAKRKRQKKKKGLAVALSFEAEDGEEG